LRGGRVTGIGPNNVTPRAVATHGARSTGGKGPTIGIWVRSGWTGPHRRIQEPSLDKRKNKIVSESGKAREGEAGQIKAKRSKEWQDIKQDGKQDKAGQDKEGQDKSSQGKARQGKAGHRGVEARSRKDQPHEGRLTHH
jgi:hypothetical protein